MVGLCTVRLNDSIAQHAANKNKFMCVIPKKLPLVIVSASFSHAHRSLFQKNSSSPFSFLTVFPSCPLIEVLSLYIQKNSSSLSPQNGSYSKKTHHWLLLQKKGR
jgi:hypothetical protein